MTSHDIVKELHTVAHCSPRSSANSILLLLQQLGIGSYGCGSGCSRDGGILRTNQRCPAADERKALGMKHIILLCIFCTICVLIIYSIWFTTCTLQRKSHKSRQTKKKHGCLLQMRFLFDVSGPLGLVAWASLAQGVCLSAILATRDAVTPLKVVCTAAVPGDERIEGMGYERLDLTIKSWIEVWRHYHNIIIFNLQSIKIKKIESVW